MNPEDARKIAQEKPELARSLEEALRRNADEKELADIISDAELDACLADDLLAEFQRRRGAEIGFESIDPDALGTVAGGKGGKSLAGCTKDYYEEEQCTATVEEYSRCWSDDRCSWFDSLYHKTNCSGLVTD